MHYLEATTSTCAARRRTMGGVRGLGVAARTRATSPRADGERGEEIRVGTQWLAAHVTRITTPVGPTADDAGRRSTEVGAAAQCARATFLARGSVRQRAPECRAKLYFGVQPFGRVKLKKFELYIKISKYESCRTCNPLQLCQRAIYGFLSHFPRKLLQSLEFRCEVRETSRC
jgi:hypothetical protein